MQRLFYKHSRFHAIFATRVPSSCFLLGQLCYRFNYRTSSRHSFGKIELPLWELRRFDRFYLCNSLAFFFFFFFGKKRYLKIFWKWLNRFNFDLCNFRNFMKNKLYNIYIYLQLLKICDHKVQFFFQFID